MQLQAPPRAGLRRRAHDLGLGACPGGREDHLRERGLPIAGGRRPRREACRVGRQLRACLGAQPGPTQDESSRGGGRIGAAAALPDGTAVDSRAAGGEGVPGVASAGEGDAAGGAAHVARTTVTTRAGIVRIAPRRFIMTSGVARPGIAAGLGGSSNRWDASTPGRVADRSPAAEAAAPLAARVQVARAERPHRPLARPVTRSRIAPRHRRSDAHARHDPQAPKALLHDHLDGGLRPATVIDLAREYGYRDLPTEDPDELAAWFRRGADRKRLELYLETFAHTVGRHAGARRDRARRRGVRRGPRGRRRRLRRGPLRAGAVGPARA